MNKGEVTARYVSLSCVVLHCLALPRSFLLVLTIFEKGREQIQPANQQRCNKRNNDGN